MPTPDTYSGMFWGYLVIWSLLALYIVLLGRRVKTLENRLNQDKG